MCYHLSSMEKDVGISKEFELKVLIKQLFGSEDKALDTTKCFPCCVSMGSRQERGRSRTGINISLLWTTALNSIVCYFSCKASAMGDKCCWQWNLSSSGAGKNWWSWTLHQGRLVWLSWDQDVIHRDVFVFLLLPHLLLPRPSVCWDLLMPTWELAQLERVEGFSEVVEDAGDTMPTLPL